MIRYELRCPAAHSFDGWFRDSAGFEEQNQAGAIACPICGATAIEKALMAPRVARPRDTPSTGEILQALRGLRKSVESHCENVGDDFAEEARKIHYGEAAARPIYGDTTPEEAEALSEEGIEISQIPWVPISEN